MPDSNQRKTFGRPLAPVMAAVCLAGGWAWSRPELSRRTTLEPVEVELLNGSVRLGRLMEIRERWVRPAAIGQTERTPRVVRFLFDQGPVDVPTAEIRRIVVLPTERRVIRSDASVAALRLGQGPTKRPEPAGWYLSNAVIEGWQPAVLQWPYYGWRYVPQACWIWANGTRRHRQDESVLFRHNFELPATASIICARLDVSADDHIESFFVNGTSVRIPTHSLLGQVSQWDLTYLLRPGRNLIAARVTNDMSSGELNYAGLCYRIVCDLLATADGAKPVPPAVQLLLANGDRVSGAVESISARQWTIRHGSSRIEVDPDWVEIALVNYSEPGMRETRSPREDKPLLARWTSTFGGRRAPPAITLGVRPQIAWDPTLAPAPARRGLLLRNGEWIEGRIEDLRQNQILIKPRYGETFGVSAHRVALLQPNGPDPEMQFFFRPADFPSVVRVRLANNDQLSGALESLTPAALTLTPHYANPVSLDLNEVLSIDFIMNQTARYRERLSRARLTSPVAAIGEADRAVPVGKDEAILTIQRALVNLGLEMRWLDANEMVEAGMLSPNHFPVLINLDQNERFFCSVRQRDDGREAIRRYVREGGTLIHLARGVPFSQAYVAERGRWQTRRPPADLNAELMVDIVTPDRRSAAARPFQLPPNQGQRMFFLLNRLSPFAGGLPSEVEVPMIADARFRPVTDERVTTPARFFPVYRLVDDTGQDYGVAMAVIRYGSVGGRPHYGIYASHLLYEATFEGTPMIEILLPKALDLALGANDVSVANLAAAPDSTGSRSAQALLEPTRVPTVPAPAPPNDLPASPKSSP